MGTVLALAATAAAIAFAIWPLLRGNSRRESETEAPDELLSQRELALNDIRDLDFDHDLGNLSNEDYVELREQYKRRAVAVLKQLRTEETRLDDEIERAVAAFRRSDRRDA